MNPEHIAVICNYRLEPDRVGGMDHFFWQFDARCKEQGIAVDWFFPNPGAYGEYSSFRMYADQALAVEQHFLDHLKKDSPSYSHIITHFTELCTPFYKQLKQLTTAKVIAVDHNPRPLKGYTFKKKVGKRLKGLLYSRYIDVFVGVSSYTVNEMIKDFGRNIKYKTIIIYNGIKTQRYIKKKNFKGSNLFMVACHLRKEKGIQDLINAVHQLHQENIKGFYIDIFGDGSFKAELKEMVTAFGLENIFTFKGSVANLHEKYHKYDFLIHPSHGETFCYSVLESLVSRLPVITTRGIGNVLNIVKEDANGYLFEAGNVDELKEKFKNVLHKRKNIKKEYILNENYASKFSLESMVNKHFNLIRCK